jgi:hypothetical protein
MRLPLSVVSLLLALTACSALPPEVPVAPLNADVAVAGFAQADLSQQWWQWAGSFENDTSPIADTTGQLCGSGQQGPVWFLAGTYGSSPAHRLCHVPAGKYLFFPLINYVVMPCAGCGGLTCPDAQATAREMTDAPIGLFAQLDGRSFTALNGHRVASQGCFNMAARVLRGRDVSPSASNGYWLALPPLSKGTHRLHFGGSLPSLSQELDYTLVVE